VFASIEEAVAVVGRGGIVVVVDDEDRENEGDLIMAGEAATPEAIAFFVKYTSGVVCAPMAGEDLDRLDIPPMVLRNQDAKGTAFTVTVDATDRVSTGVSAADRARTIQVLADPASGPNDVTRPGHVFPLRYHPGGVLRRPGHTEAAVDLARLAGLRPVGVLSELVNADGTMSRLDDCRRFAERHDLPLITIADLVAYRRSRERFVERVAEANLPRVDGRWRTIAYRADVDGAMHLALVLGEPERKSNVLVRMHAECVVGDVFRTPVCGCGISLDRAMARIAEAGEGAVVYLRAQSGKVDASPLHCPSTADKLGVGTAASDERDYGTGAMILADLGLSTLRLLTDSPGKRSALSGFGLSVVATEPLGVAARSSFGTSSSDERAASPSRNEDRGRSERSGIGMAPPE
jgi:3,4-dihydroxy 2-butanone 4-phosphate synthase / GTP cyclohydrolase II